MRLRALLLLTTWAWLGAAEDVAPACSPRPLVLVHVMPWFESKAGSGRWGWHWTMEKTDPDKGGLASHDRPVFGPYDSGDRAVIANQVALMKAAGIDGAIIDWNGPDGFDDYVMIHRNTTLLIAELKRAGLKFALCAEDNPGHRLMKERKLTRAQATAKVAASFAWADAHWLTDPAHVRIGGRPVLFIFGPQYLDEAEWVSIRATLTQNPLVYALPHLSRRPRIDGAFAWIPVSEGKSVTTETWTKELSALYAGEAKDRRPIVAVAFPGYRDFYAQAGAGKSYGSVEYRDGRTFADSFDQAMRSGAPIVQIATWNDYGEGTGVEPTLERGLRDLELIRRRLRPEADPAEIRRILDAAKRQGTTASGDKGQ
jgi:hypothetical protein